MLLRFNVGFNSRYVAVGELKGGKIGLLGTVFFNGYNNFNFRKPISKDDITFFTNIESELVVDYEELTPYSDGNFVVLSNKGFTLVDDLEIIEYHVDQIVEQEITDYSLTLQMKVGTFITAQESCGGNDAKMLANALLAGTPYFVTSDAFTMQNSINQFDSLDISSYLPAIQKHKQEIIAQLNMFLGVSSLAVNKEAGVSEAEAKGNSGLQEGFENAHLKARNEPLGLLNKKFGTNIKAVYSEKSIEQLSSLEKFERGTEILEAL